MCRRHAFTLSFRASGISWYAGVWFRAIMIAGTPAFVGTDSAAWNLFFLYVGIGDWPFMGHSRRNGSVSGSTGTPPIFTSCEVSGCRHHVGSPVSLPRLHRLWQTIHSTSHTPTYPVREKIKTGNQFMAVLGSFQEGDSSVALKNRAPSE